MIVTSTGGRVAKVDTPVLVTWDCVDGFNSQLIYLKIPGVCCKSLTPSQKFCDELTVVNFYLLV